MTYDWLGRTVINENEKKFEDDTHIFCLINYMDLMDKLEIRWLFKWKFLICIMINRSMAKKIVTAIGVQMA